MADIDDLPHVELHHVAGLVDVINGSAGGDSASVILLE